jgi:hypothetical protein
MLGDGASGNRARDFAGSMSTHAIGNDKEAEIWEGYLAGRVTDNHKDRVFVVFAFKTHRLSQTNEDMFCLWRIPV